jgi:hypothetical protein
MRVTKIIREYVTKRVNEKFPKTKEEIAWEEYKSKMNDAISEANEKVYKFAQEVAEELNAKYGFDSNYCLYGIDYYNAVRSDYNYDFELYVNQREAREERDQKISKTIEEILIELELGGNKETLEKLLKEI